MSSTKKGRVFVTGASGFVGANVVRTLLQEDYSVHILNRTKTLSWRLTNIAKQLTIHSGDVTDFKSIKKALQSTQPEYIIHLATYGAYHFQTEFDKIFQVNSEGIKNLLEASKNIAYKAFINTGSSSEYGYKNKPMQESDPCNPTSYYAATKLGATHLCKVFAEINKKPIATFRLFSVYGPYEAPTRLVPAIMKATIQKETIKLAPGSQRRDFIYIDDVCKAYLTALTYGPKLQGEIYNIGTGKEYTNDEVVEKLFTITKEKTTIDKGAYPKRTWDTLHWSASLSHTKHTLGWKPSYSLDKGLASTYSWFTKNLASYQ